jgi:hypothetical protein
MNRWLVYGVALIVPGGLAFAFVCLIARQYREKREDERADLPERWRAFISQPDAWIKPANLPPVKPLKAQKVSSDEKLARFRQRMEKAS